MKKILLIILTIFAMQKLTAQATNFDVYDPALLDGKGVLVLLNEADNNRSSDSRHTWWVPQAGFTLDVLTGEENLKGTLKFDKLHPYGLHTMTDMTKVRLIDFSSDFNGGFLSPIPAGPLRVVGQDDRYYTISAKLPALTKTDSPVSFLVRKSQLDSLGFTYIPCTDLLKLLKSGRVYLPTNNLIATPIFPQLAIDPRSADSYYINFILRTEASLSSPFICIIEPWQCQFGYEIISKDKYWYKLKIHAGYTTGYTTVTSDGVRMYKGGTYVGYWQAPVDEAGFPYPLVAIVGDYNGWYSVLKALKEEGK